MLEPGISKQRKNTGVGLIALHRLALFLFSHRLLALARWDMHFLAVRLVNFIGRQKQQAGRFLSTRSRPVYLNLGSGPRGKDNKHWVNIDGYNDRNVHFRLDFARPLPFPDNTFDGAFCEHVIEHFTYEDGRRVCTEILRLLRPGGVFRIIVPDAERVVRTYLDDPGRLIAYRGQPDLTAMQVVNDYFRQRYEHQFLYDSETMQQLLSEAGFTEIEQCTPGNGRCSDLLIDDEKYAWESLYFEATKSAAGIA